jgi:hypothetical protein
MTMQPSTVRPSTVRPRSARRRAPFAPALAAVLAAAAIAAPAHAGIHYRTVTRVEPEGQKAQVIRAEAWVDGGSARIELTESDNPLMPGGAYLLTRDGGKSVVIVDPEEKTWARYDLEAMLGSIGNIMQSMGPLLDFDVSNVAVGKLLEEPGGTIHGLPTTHYRYRTSYVMTVKILGMQRANAVERVEDRWLTDALDDAALGVWLRKAPRTGVEDLDRLIDAEMAKVQGVTLKSTDVTTTTGQKGKRSATSRTTMEVSELERGVTVDPAKFEVPAGYTETQMVVPGVPMG